MALNIKNDEAQRLSRELADLTGESLTTAISVAVGERLERLRTVGGPLEGRAERILVLGRHISGALATTDLAVDDLYDKRGMPT